MAILKYNYAGKDIDLNLTTPDRYKVKKIKNTPLPKERIIGIDTESINYNAQLLLKYLQLYCIDKQLVQDMQGIEPLSFLFQYLLDNYGHTYEKPSLVGQRSKEARKEREHKKHGRDGRRQYFQPVLLAFFNLQYDLGRLIDVNQLFRRIIGFGQDSFTFQFDKYEIEIEYSCLGVACPSFKWIIYDKVNRRILPIIGFDGTSYFKNSLKEVTKQLNLTSKIDLGEEKDLFTRDWYIKPPTQDEIDNFIEYAITDARCHAEIYHALVELLQEIDEHIIDKQGIIPLSAPSCAARIMLHFSKIDEFQAPPEWVQQIGIDAYKGAISFCSLPGYCKDITVKDISSAYPHVMSILPDFTTVSYRRLSPVTGKRLEDLIKKWTLSYQELAPIWGVVVADFQALDAVYPVAVSYAESKQIGVYGDCVRFPITIPELIIGVLTERLEVSKIYDGCVLIGDNANSPLRLYVERMYHLKATSEKNSPMYLVAKLLMNSLYGKLIEKRHNHKIVAFHDNDHFFLIPNVETKTFKKRIREEYLQNGEEVAVDVAESLVEEYPLEYKFKDYIHLSEYLQEETWSTGFFFNALYAAQITGFTRAKLMAASSYCNALAGDTDSIFIPDKTAKKDLTKYLNSVGAITPEIGLGSFETELEHASGLILKKKQYYLEVGGKIKEAHHAIQSVSGKQFESEEVKTSQAVKMQIRLYLQKLYKDGFLEYSTKERPNSLQDAIRNNRVLGKFISKDIKLTYNRINSYQEFRDKKVIWKKFTFYKGFIKENN